MDTATLGLPSLPRLPRLARPLPRCSPSACSSPSDCDCVLKRADFRMPYSFGPRTAMLPGKGIHGMLCRSTSGWLKPRKATRPVRPETNLLSSVQRKAELFAYEASARRANSSASGSISKKLRRTTAATSSMKVALEVGP